MLFIDPHADLTNTLQFINNFTKHIGISQCGIDAVSLRGLINGAVSDGHFHGGNKEKASPYRKIASFVAYFISSRPIPQPFPKDKYIENLHKIENHQNAIIALEIAIDSLHGAKIHRRDGVFILKEKIQLSGHSYVDIIDALVDVTPTNGMKMVAVLLEQMSYRQNPDCEYK